MEYIILLVSVASLSANVFLIKKVSDWFKRDALEVELLEPVWESKIMDCCASKEVDLSGQVPTVSTSSVDESSSAWRNATGLSAAGPASVSPSMPPPLPGPLERPYGFPG